MKKRILVTLLTALVIVSPVNGKVISKPKEFYAHMGMVTKVKAKRNGLYKISVVDAAGRKWAWLDDDGDWNKGDFAALMMYNSETPFNVYDDQIIDARYVGAIKFFM